jgi:multiple sugar transport system permease protein/sn-glycerol 3-phosphate transport system permease protein
MENTSASTSPFVAGRNRAINQPHVAHLSLAGRIGKQMEAFAPYLLLLPLLGLIVLFIYWPLVYSFYLAFFDWNFVTVEKPFVGFDNFTRLWGDRRFIQSLQGTWKYFVILVPIQVFLPLGLALMLWPIRKSKMQNTYRFILFSPTVIAYSVAAVLWLWIFNPLQGVLNKVLIEFGVERINWLSDKNVAIWSIVIVASWKTIGFHLLLYLAALEAVPNDLIEAAQLDGANNWQTMQSIRFPLITPTFFFVLVTTVISVNDDVFGAINVLTEGGPFNSTSNIVYYLYEQGFVFFQIGSASAVSVIVFMATALLTWMQFRFGERFVHYG